LRTVIQAGNRRSAAEQKGMNISSTTGGQEAVDAGNQAFAVRVAKFCDEQAKIRAWLACAAVPLERMKEDDGAKNVRLD